MDNKYNSFDFDIQERAAIPRSFSIKTGMDSANKLKNYLYRVIHNPEANQKLYFSLLDKGFDRQVLIRGLGLELLPGKFIDVYFKLKKEHKGAMGQSGATGFIIKNSRIVIALYADIENDCIVWEDSYITTIDHEITHAFQAIEVAIRYLQIKNKHIPSYSPSFDEIMKWMTKVNLHNQKYTKQLKDMRTNPETYLKYLSSPGEIGARAHALFRELYAKDRNLLAEIIEYCEYGHPNFHYINRKLSQGKWHGWTEMTNMSKREMEDFGLTEQETNGYALKHELLNRLFGFYTAQYK